MGGTHMLQADDYDYWSADLVKEWISTYHDILQKEGKVVEIHAVPQLARIETDGGSLMQFRGHTWDPKQGNPGTGLQTIAVQPPFGYMSLGLEDQEHQKMMDAPDADTMMACQSEVGTGFCLHEEGIDEALSVSCQYCQHRGIYADTKMLVGMKLKPEKLDESGDSRGSYNLWNHDANRLRHLDHSKLATISLKVSSVGGLCQTGTTKNAATSGRGGQANRKRLRPSTEGHLGSYSFGESSQRPSLPLSGGVGHPLPQRR